MALSTSRTSTVRGRPPRLAGEINGDTSAPNRHRSDHSDSEGHADPQHDDGPASTWGVLRPGAHHESQPTHTTQLLLRWALRPVVNQPSDSSSLGRSERSGAGVPRHFRDHLHNVRFKTRESQIRRYPMFLRHSLCLTRSECTDVPTQHIITNRA